MFFIFGISQKEELVKEWTMLCEECGNQAKFRLFVRYSYFSLFFIPLIKWNKEFWVINSCCNDIYSISKDKGQDCMWYDDEVIRFKDLRLMNKKIQYRCKYCQSKLDRLSRYCPECGREL